MIRPSAAPRSEERLVVAGYERAHALTAEHGRTYHAAARLLPRANRFGVYALYGFARHADDIVDLPGSPAEQLARLDAVETELHASLSRHGRRPSWSPRVSETTTVASPEAEMLIACLTDTVLRFSIPVDSFGPFLHSMRMDTPGAPEFRSRYRTLADLAEYTDGSAAVIGEQMLPLLGVGDAAGCPTIVAGARALGEAFQLTNFLRDVAEDLDRDRIYLPLDELEAFGVDEEHLRRCRSTDTATPSLRRALAHLIAINRDTYRRAAPSIAMLPARTRPAIAAAAQMYEGILTEIERNDLDVMAVRAVVTPRRRLALAARAILESGGRAIPSDL